MASLHELVLSVFTVQLHPWLIVNKEGQGSTNPSGSISRMTRSTGLIKIIAYSKETSICFSFVFNRIASLILYIVVTYDSVLPVAISCGDTPSLTTQPLKKETPSCCCWCDLNFFWLIMSAVSFLNIYVKLHFQHSSVMEIQTEDIAGVYIQYKSLRGSYCNVNFSLFPLDTPLCQTKCQIEPDIK